MKTVYKFIVLFLIFTHVACKDDFDNNVEKTDSGSVSAVLSPQWLEHKVDSIARTYNSSPETGEYPYPWVYSVKHNKQEYILILDLLNSCWTCGHLYYTNSGEFIEPLSDLYISLEAEENRTKLWPKDNSFPDTSNGLMFQRPSN